MPEKNSGTKVSILFYSTNLKTNSRQHYTLAPV